jgi:hypothetical protein
MWIGVSDVEERARARCGEELFSAHDANTIHLLGNRRIFDEGDLGGGVAFACHLPQNRHDGPNESARAEESIEGWFWHLRSHPTKHAKVKVFWHDQEDHS